MHLKLNGETPPQMSCMVKNLKIYPLWHRIEKQPTYFWNQITNFNHNWVAISQARAEEEPQSWNRLQSQLKNLHETVAHDFDWHAEYILLLQVQDRSCYISTDVPRAPMTKKVTKSSRGLFGCVRVKYSSLTFVFKYSSNTCVFNP